MKINIQHAYLTGLIIGRGRLFELGRVVIEFSHTNKILNGIARCPKCNSVATQKNKIYACKNNNCNSSGFTPLQKTYDQVSETKKSIENLIIPFLSETIEFKHSIMANPSITLLILDFDRRNEDWKVLTELLGTQFHFHTGRIPPGMYASRKELQIEFINGILDTSGFCNSGGWVPRKGKNSNIRQRIYFQIVRNWYLAVELDNFLRGQFDIPIQTIDWGHPNIRDGNLAEAMAGKSSAYAREHQIKIYPEYLRQFKFRISSKQKMFEELIEHNDQGDFTNREDWFPPSVITKFKPLHPDEQNARMALPVRKHFDSFWQINLALGCKYLNKMSNAALNSDVFALTGKLDDEGPLELVVTRIEKSRPVIKWKPTKSHMKKSKTATKASGIKSRSRDDLELATYPILKEYFDAEYFSSNSEGEFHITNYLTLSAFMKDQPQEFIELFEECEEYKIRPDLVGFDKIQKELIFVESKVETLDMRMVGQLMGYCLVAQPSEAFLISTQLLSPRLINAISAKPDVLNYGENRRIKIGQLKGKKVEFHDF